MSRSFAQLDSAAADVINILRGIREYSDARIAVIGGLALWKYIPTGRTTEFKDVDFIINISSAPTGVKQRLLALPNTPFVQHAQYFYYKTPEGIQIQIDVTPEFQSPYMPTAATKLRDIPVGGVPYISPTDLMVFKIFSCGLRAQAVKRRTDATDAEQVLKMMTKRSSLNLTSAQRIIVEPCIADLVAHGSEDEKWWRERLGLPVEK